MTKHLTAEDLEEIRSQNFSTAYHDLVHHPDDWQGMIAYCHYKQDIIQRCERFVGDSGDLRDDLRSRKNLTTHDIAMLRKNAGQRVEAYAQEAIDAARPTIERDAVFNETKIITDKLSKDVDNLFTKIRALPERFEKGQFLKFAISIIASVIGYIVVLLIADFIGWFADRDPGLQIQKLRADLGLRHVEPAANGEEIESTLPAVPEAFQDQAIMEESVEHLEQRLEVWRKASHTGETNESNGFRKDICGAWMRFDSFDDRSSQFGWTIGLLLPSFPRSAERVNDLQPLHWQNVESSSQNWRCKVTSEGDENITMIP